MDRNTPIKYLVLTTLICTKAMSSNLTLDTRSTQISHENLQTQLFRAYKEDRAIIGDYVLNDWRSSGYESGAKLPDSNGMNVYHVRDYGAIPNDGVDDLPAIQEAIKAAEANGGGIVKFEAGQYDLNIAFDENSEFDHDNAIWVSGSNIILKGASDNPSETVIKQWRKVPLDSAAWDAVRTAHTVNFGIPKSLARSRINWVSKEVTAGENTLYFASTSDFQVGQSVEIVLLSWRPPRVPNDDDKLLEEHLLFPLYSDGLDARNVGLPYKPFSLYRKVVAVNEDSIELDSPIPRDLELKFNPGVYVTKYTVKNCGIRDLTIRSIHDGSYIEGGYDTGGIGFREVESCWAENINIENTVLGLSMNSSVYSTARNIAFNGTGIHHGIGLYHSFNNLVENSTFNSTVGHLISFNALSSGNVVRNIHYRGVEDRISVSAGIDFHSGYSTFNLLENITNTKIASSGAKNGNSSSSHYNVLWNVRKGNEQQEGNGLYAYCWYTSSAYSEGIFSKYSDCYRRHPKTLYVGLAAYEAGNQVTINNNPNDIIDNWRYIEKLNSYDVYPRSLYEGQKYLTYNNYPLFDGVEPINLSIGERFEPLAGVTASSQLYGDISMDISVLGEIDTTQANSGEIEYSVIDQLGLKTIAKRPFTVSEDNCNVEDPNWEKYPPFQAGNTYISGDLVSQDKLVWRANWWSHNTAPSLKADAWELLSSIPVQWNPSVAYVGGDEVNHHQRRYKAKWWTKGEAPFSTSDVWIDIGEASCK